MFEGFNINDLISIINGVGFPMFIALIMLLYTYKQTQTHKEEVKMLSDTIDNNTLAMTQIKTEIETFLKFTKEG